jgi:hypothetical protein
MTKDLEQTLNELGPEFTPFARRVKAAYEPMERVNFAALTTPHPGRATGWSVGYLVAASLFIFLGLGVYFQARPTHVSKSSSRIIYTVAYAPTEDALASIVNSQRADGSWENDFLTQQNAAALRSATGQEERIAYKKAVRYLRTRGLKPLTDEELRDRGNSAAQILAQG